MIQTVLPIAIFALSFPAGGVPALPSSPTGERDAAELYAESFDFHWENLNENYPYFELYGVDWDAERAEHRPKAIAAANGSEFAWELARMISSMPDPHVSFIPALDTIVGKWSIPDLVTHTVERRPFVTSWEGGEVPETPAACAHLPFPYPEIVSICGEPPVGVMHILAGGPLGSSFEVQLRWPDGTVVDHTLHRPKTSNLPPPSKHYGESWLVTARVGKVGYLRIRTFSPEMATLGPDGKMTTMLRAALIELKGTDSIILDLQGNGGGVVAASDPFLGHLLKKTRRYAWGNANGKKRVIRRQRLHYSQEIVAIVDKRSASGGEWAARILRDAGRAIVVGGKTSGAEAAVHESRAPDGSVVNYSAWPMIEPGVTPFQATGIEVDHYLPLTISDVHQFGYEEARTRVRRARYAKALELLGAPASDLDRIVESAAPGFE